MLVYMGHKKVAHGYSYHTFSVLLREGKGVAHLRAGCKVYNPARAGTHSQGRVAGAEFARAFQVMSTSESTRTSRLPTSAGKRTSI